MTVTSRILNIALCYNCSVTSILAISTNKVITLTTTKTISLRVTATTQVVNSNKSNNTNNSNHYHSSHAHLSPIDAQLAIIPFIDSHITNATSVTITPISNAHKKLLINPYNLIVQMYPICGLVIIANHVLFVYSHLKIKPSPVPSAIPISIKYVLNSNYNKISSETNTHAKIVFNAKFVKRNLKIWIMFS